MQGDCGAFRISLNCTLAVMMDTIGEMVRTPLRRSGMLSQIGKYPQKGSSRSKFIGIRASRNSRRDTRNHPCSSPSKHVAIP